MVKVKICGITNLNDAKVAVDLGADAIGFVFAESPRKIKKEKAGLITRKLPPFITFVGLFVNETPENIEEICNFCGIDAVQLHGNERPNILNKLRHRKTIKAFRIKTERDIVPISKYKANAVLLDGYAKDKMGGSGISFNWEIVKKVKTSSAIIIAGGLTPLNVSNAIKIARPYGVDVSSGVESRTGKKDKTLIRKFIDNAKSASI